MRDGGGAVQIDDLADAWSGPRRLADKWGTKALSPTIVERLSGDQDSAPEQTGFAGNAGHEARSKAALLGRGITDAVSCPVLGEPAQPNRVPWPGGRKRFLARSQTGLCNSTGWPAAVAARPHLALKVCRSAYSVVGQPWRDDVVLAVCGYLELKTGGCRSRPSDTNYHLRREDTKNTRKSLRS